jgi:hypothetical protein
MAPTLHIIASCADRKRHPPAVRLRDIEGGSVALRFSAWRAAVIRSNGPRVRAEELYQGGYWSVVRELPELAARMGWEPRLWIASAGYGVVDSDKQLVSYSATFSSGHEDSVSSLDEADATRKWWSCATAPASGLGSSLATLTKKEPGSTVLIVASPAYVDAMADDLAAAVEHVRARGTVFVISSRSPANAAGAASASWIPSSSALQGSLGGALVSLHARVARHLLSTIPPRDFRKEKLSHMTKKLNEEAGPTAKRAVGAAMTDDAVIAFIRQRVTVDAKASHTRLLRELRESGQACEQGRFRRLFKRVKS